MSKLVSIIIPAYNAEEYIEKSVKAVINQNYKNIEIIIVIDGATDGTLDKCKKLSEQDKRIRYIEQPNGGVMKARFNGIQNAKGDYLMFSDSDDYIQPNSIDELIKIAEKFDPDIIKYRYIQIPKMVEQPKYCEKEECLVLKSEFNEKIYKLFLEGYQLHSINNEFVKKDLFNKIEINKEQRLSFGEDFLLNLELFTKAQKVVLSNKILYNYISIPTSLTRTNDISRVMSNMESCIKVYNVLNKYIKIWNMESAETIKQVDERILYETASLLYKLQLSEYNKDLVKELLIKNGIKEKIHNISENEISKERRFYKQMIEILDMIN